MHKINILREIFRIHNNSLYVSNGFFLSSDEEVVNRLDHSVHSEMFLNLNQVVSLEGYGGIFVLKTTNGTYVISEEEAEILLNKMEERNN